MTCWPFPSTSLAPTLVSPSTADGWWLYAPAGPSTPPRCCGVSVLVLHGTVGVTTPALHALLGGGVPVVLLDRGGRALGRLEAPSSAGVLLRRQQLAASADPVRSLALAKAAVVGKVQNQRVLLIRRGRRRREGSVTAAGASLARMAERALTAVDLAELVGVEGAAASVYFRVVRSLLPGEVSFARRDRRGPDVVNAAINYCSALLRETVVAAIWAQGLDLGLSHLHRSVPGRPTLAFDLMEEWRAVLVEGTVLPLVSLGALRADGVSWYPEGPRLTDTARRVLIGRFYDRLASPVSARPPLPYRTTYTEAVRTQAATYAAWVAGRGDYRPFRWR